MAAARLGSFSQAAAHLGVTQPTLSQSIASLEQRLEGTLFTRIPRQGTELTRAGERLLIELEPILAGIATLPSAVAGGSGVLAGEVVFGVYAPLAPIYSAALTARMRQPAPAVTVRFVEGDLVDLSRMLLRRQLDAALMYSDEAPPDLEVLAVQELAPRVIVADSHPLARTRAGTVSLRDLAHEPLALLSAPQASGSIQGIFRAVGATPNVRFTSPSAEVVRSYVAAGLAYSILHHPQLSGFTHLGRSLAAFDIVEPVPRRSLSVAFPPRSPRSDATRMVAHLCRDICHEIARTQRLDLPAAPGRASTEPRTG